MESHRIENISKDVYRKAADDKTIVADRIPMRGVLTEPEEDGDYAVLKVPQEFAEQVFESIRTPEMQIGFGNAHVSVMTADELEEVGYIEEYGQEYDYTLGPVVSCNPDGWDEIERVYFIECMSPTLEALRESHGLTPKMYGKHEFHITIAVVPVGRNNG